MSRRGKLTQHSAPFFFTSVKFLKVFKHEIFGSVTFIPSKPHGEGNVGIEIFFLSFVVIFAIL
jgi:hypothetical protein